eukprot:TRINITY_DN8016_c0_g3_i1.p1 TRINITY_DN8016_c0_g3~~TRINITY_DN8016_c0_g3_i1.p1  ORF type:complete len:591 (-),score=165.41 TRINITY_DN8016_c0_g3_i1:249-2021(-)
MSNFQVQTMHRNLTGLLQRVGALESFTTKVQGSPAYKLANQSIEEDIKMLRNEFIVLRSTLQSEFGRLKAEFENLKDFLQFHDDPPPHLIPAAGGVRALMPCSLGASPNSRRDSLTATSVAESQASSGSISAVSIDDSKRCSFLKAVHEMNQKEAKKLLKNGNDGWTEQDSAGMTAVHWAAIKDLQEVMYEFLHLEKSKWSHKTPHQISEDLGTRDFHLRTAFHYAAAYGRKDMVRMFMDSASFLDIQATDQDGWTALHHASDMGKWETCKVLLSHHRFTKAINATDTMKRSALHVAAKSGHARVIKHLLDSPFLEAHASEDVEGDTPLLIAAARGHLEATKLLLGHKLVLEDLDHHSDHLRKVSGIAHERVQHLVQEAMARYAETHSGGLVNPDKEPPPFERGQSGRHAERQHRQHVQKAGDQERGSQSSLPGKGQGEEEQEEESEDSEEAPVPLKPEMDAARLRFKNAILEVFGTFAKFQSIADRDKNKDISIFELKMACRKNGCTAATLSDNDISIVMKALDQDDSGTVSLEEFGVLLDTGAAQKKKKRKVGAKGKAKSKAKAKARSAGSTGQGFSKQASAASTSRG